MKHLLKLLDLSKEEIMDILNLADQLKYENKNGIDHKILKTLIMNFKGGPVGVGTLATSISEDSGTLEEVYEPFLLKEGFLVRTQRGRVATELAYQHLGMEAYLNQRKYSPDEGGSLF
jgi:Holliday junction resolvasome RuvABC ATP-dependent DNA helicase subunit